MKWHYDARTYFLLDRLSLDQETAQTDRQREGEKRKKSISLTMRINAVADGSRGGGNISGGESKTILVQDSRALRYVALRYATLRRAAPRSSERRAGERVNGTGGAVTRKKYE